MALPPERRNKKIIDKDERVAQMDELERISSEAKTTFYGTNFFENAKKFYNIKETLAPAPSFRPTVNIPQLQVLVLNEATDLADLSIRVYIWEKGKQRVKQQEAALQAQWHQGMFNVEIMYASIWSLLSGIGYVQVGYDPDARRGQGEVWLRHRSPDTVFHDPNSLDSKDWQFLIIKDYMYLEEVRRMFPETAADLKPRVRRSSPQADQRSFGLEMPHGPMSLMTGLPLNDKPDLKDSLVCVRYCFLRDATIEDIPEDEQDRMAIEMRAKGLTGHPPTRRFKYPNGRFIVDCEGEVLADGDNPTPLGRFPVEAIYGIPPVCGAFPPPPINFSKDLQDLAGRMYTQSYENAVRLNNGFALVNEAAGIDIEKFGGLPGEVHVISSNVPANAAVFIGYPQPMPESFIKLPEILLAKQKELQGFTPQRMGEVGTGNIGTELFDASIFQSQKLTRMRAILLHRSVQSLAELVFYTMAKNYSGVQFPVINPADPEDLGFMEWSDISDRMMDHEILLDPGSIRPTAQAALRALLPQLVQAGMISRRKALEILEVPGAEEVAQELENEQKLAALMTVKQRRR